MSAYLDERYFDWLYGQVCSVKTKNPSKSYRNLLHILYTKEFVWLIPNDDNRIEDGKDLRYEFFESEGITPGRRDRHWLELDCSIFELLVALSRRLSFETDEPVDIWFWELLDNIGLKDHNDRADISEEHVHEVINRIIWRTFDYDGTGSFFPLQNPECDQRETEIWYQACAYILETR